MTDFGIQPAIFVSRAEILTYTRPSGRAVISCDKTYLYFSLHVERVHESFVDEIMTVLLSIVQNLFRSLGGSNEPDVTSLQDIADPWNLEKIFVSKK